MSRVKLPSKNSMELNLSVDLSQLTRQDPEKNVPVRAAVVPAVVPADAADTETTANHKNIKPESYGSGYLFLKTAYGRNKNLHLNPKIIKKHLRHGGVSRIEP